MYGMQPPTFAEKMHHLDADFEADYSVRGGPGYGDTAEDQSWPYEAADSLLLGEDQKSSGHTTRGGSLRLRILLPWHRATRMRRSSLVRAVFNYPEPGTKLRNTAWLDGLRGLAAFQVFIFHYCDGWLDRTKAWGTGQYAERHWYYLPLIRTLFNGGDAAVCLFFAISGYALSYSLLVKMRRGQQNQLLSSLSSSIFRRGIRLYTPVLAMTLLLMLAVRLFSLPKPMEYEAAPTFLSEVLTWSNSFVWLLLPLWRGQHWERRINRYDGGISWTIPMEYYGSLQVYMAVLFLCRTRSILVRRALMLLWVVQRIMRDDWSAAQFMLGMVFADYQVDREFRGKNGSPDRREPSKTGSSWGKRLPRPRTFFFLNLFAFGFYLSGLPSPHWVSEEKHDHRIHSRPFFDWITQPLAAAGAYDDRNVDRYLVCLASLCCFVAIGETARLKRITEFRGVQYLGKISFGLYLCHIFIRAWLAPLKAACLGLTGVNPATPETAHNAQLFLAYLMMMIPATTINFIAAGLFERLIDRPSVNLGKWFEVWCLAQGQEPASETASLPLHHVNADPRHDSVTGGQDRSSTVHK